MIGNQINATELFLFLNICKRSLNKNHQKLYVSLWDHLAFQKTTQPSTKSFEKLVVDSLRFASVFKAISQFGFLFGCSENIYLIKQWSWKRSQLMGQRFFKIKVRIHKHQYKSSSVDILLVENPLCSSKETLFWSIHPLCCRVQVEC